MSKPNNGKRQIPPPLDLGADNTRMRWFSNGRFEDESEPLPIIYNFSLKEFEEAVAKAKASKNRKCSPPNKTHPA